MEDPRREGWLIRRPALFFARLLLATTGVLAISPVLADRAVVQRVEMREAKFTAEPSIRFIYALPADGEDRRYDVNRHLTRSIKIVQRALAQRMDGKSFRIPKSGSEPEILFLRLSRNDDWYKARGMTMGGELEKELDQSMLLDHNTRYLMFYDGSGPGHCGTSPNPPQVPGVMAKLYLRASNPDGRPCIASRAKTDADLPSIFEWRIIHELFHTLGAVQPCASNYLPYGHVSDDPRDVMYTGPLHWKPDIIDVGNDDYFRHDRANCADLQHSPFFTRIKSDSE